MLRGNVLCVRAFRVRLINLFLPIGSLHSLHRVKEVTALKGSRGHFSCRPQIFYDVNSLKILILADHYFWAANAGFDQYTNQVAFQLLEYQMWWAGGCIWSSSSPDAQRIPLRSSMEGDSSFCGGWEGRRREVLSHRKKKNSLSISVLPIQSQWKRKLQESAHSLHTGNWSKSWRTRFR